MARPAMAMMMALPMLACGGAPEGPIAFSVVPTCLEFRQATERVFRSDTEWRAAHRENSDGTPPAIDFARSMVAGHFDGRGEPCTSFSVQGVSRRDDTLVVTATRHERTGCAPTVLGFPQVMLELPRHDLPVRFEIQHVRGESTGPVRACL